MALGRRSARAEQAEAFPICADCGRQLLVGYKYVTGGPIEVGYFQPISQDCEVFFIPKLEGG